VGVSFNDSSCAFFAKKLGISAKKLSDLVRAASLEDTAEFWTEIAPFSVFQLVWSDEVGSDLKSSRRRQGRSPCGERAYYFGKDGRGYLVGGNKRYSSIGIRLSLHTPHFSSFFSLFFWFLSFAHTCSLSSSDILSCFLDLVCFMVSQ
jgi:hypothetical protein